LARGDPRIEIGWIARAHGIHGEVVIATHDPDSTLLEGIATIWVGGVACGVTGVRGTQRGWLVQLDGITTRNDAEAMRGKLVEVDREVLQLADEDVLLADLVGCRVELVDGTPWGTIHAVEPGMQDLLVIHDGELERLLPLVDEFVKRIDLDGGVVTVDPPDGLPVHRMT
jgi:16S rRNA processing protein RimM